MESSPGLMMAASKRVAQILHLHSCSRRNVTPATADAVARLQPLRDCDLAARRLAELHRAARDGLIGPTTHATCTPVSSLKTAEIGTRIDCPGYRGGEW